MHEPNPDQREQRISDSSLKDLCLSRGIYPLESYSQPRRGPRVQPKPGTRGVTANWWRATPTTAAFPLRRPLWPNQLILKGCRARAPPGTFAIRTRDNGIAQMTHAEIESLLCSLIDRTGRRSTRSRGGKRTRWQA